MKRMISFLMAALFCFAAHAQESPDNDWLEYDTFDGMTKVSKMIDGHRTYGMVNSEGEIVVPVEYRFIHGWLNGRVVVEKAGEGVGMVDYSGNELIPCIYDYMYNSMDEYIPVKLDEKWGFFNLETGKLAIDFQYDDFQACTTDEGDWFPGFANSPAPVKKGDFWGYVDRNNHVVFKFIYDEAGIFEDGLAKVMYHQTPTKLSWKQK